MKLSLAKTSILGAAVAAVLLTAGCNGEAEKAPAEVTLDTVEEQVTYIVGYNMAKQAQTNGLQFDKAVMAAAIEDVSAEKEPRIAQAEQQKIMMAFQEEQQNKREQEMAQAAEENKAKAQQFLDENAKKEGVVVTDSGLQYKVLEAVEGDAPKPTADDVVKVHYHGTLVDGTVFDSSVDRGEPVSFPVKGVIKGWVEALQLMKVGEKYELYIPPALAYGEAGTSGKIGPNAALIFEVELLEINPEIEGHGGAHGHGGSGEGSGEEGEDSGEGETE